MTEGVTLPPDPSRPAGAASPVRVIPTDDPGRKPEPGTALCLSGGGYRAMVFHIGALWRLHEGGLLSTLKRISCVSGGSITGAMLAIKWTKVIGAGRDVFVHEIVTPLRELAGKTIDIRSAASGIFLPGRASDHVASAYDRHLFKGRTLQDIPDEPRFIFNATNIQTGALWRFMKPYMADYRVGRINRPDVLLAKAVAASSAFPPFLSPAELSLSAGIVQPIAGADLNKPPFTTKAILTDGGVYDNLGLETAWKRYDTILVSNGGGKLAPEESPSSDWPRHAYRVLDLIDNQVRSLRVRQLIDSYKAPAADAAHRKGTYWGIRTDIDDYGLNDALSCPLARTTELAQIPTRLKAMDNVLQERLINWGYAVCDAALRKHFNPALRQGNFPYNRGV